jgi:hypothetical protein
MPITDETRKRIFDKLKTHLAACAPPMVVNTKAKGDTYELIGNKPVPYGYDKKMVPGMYFASIAHRKDSVVLYFFPAYYNEKLLEVAPTLNACLKGKTCFHFKKEEQLNEKELQAMLKKGMEAWARQGYMM